MSISDGEEVRVCHLKQLGVCTKEMAALGLYLRSRGGVYTCVEVDCTIECSSCTVSLHSISVSITKLLKYHHAIYDVPSLSKRSF